MTAYYNEIDPFAAQWLRNLIDAGHIAPGVVDERSIEDVRPSDLAGFTQCHFFAGIGVWSYALRRAGWPDDRPVWTGSCPCQPFSTAGKGAGFADERHLWPAWFHLLSQCQPTTVFGEQVASKDTGAWLDLVHADLEGLGYAFGAVPFPSAGIGAPHIRDRLFWVAHAERTGICACGRGKDVGAPGSLQGPNGQRERLRADLGERCSVCGLAHTASPGPQGGERGRQPPDAQLAALERAGEAGGLADLHGTGRSSRGKGRATVGHGSTAEPDRGIGGLGHAGQHDDASQGQAASAGQPQADRPADQPGRPGVSLGGLADTFGKRPSSDAGAQPCFYQRGDIIGRSGMFADEPTGPVNGFWRDADWLLCRDGRWRPVEPGTFPLAHGAPSRVGRLCAYGNAINAEAARIFIESVMSIAL